MSKRNLTRRALMSFTSHLATELLERATGMKLTHVPYRGSANVMQNLMGGQIQLAFDSAAVTVPLARSGKIRLIGAGSAQRSAAMPEIPTIAEQGVPNFEAVVWTGLYAPAGTPAPIVARLNEALSLLAAIGASRRVERADADAKFVGQSSAADRPPVAEKYL